MNEQLHKFPLKDIAFKAIMIMPNLLLYKPSKISKSEDHLKALEKNIELSLRKLAALKKSYQTI